MKIWRVPLAALLAALAFNQMSVSPTDSTAQAADKKAKGAPGPITGAGLPILLAAGAYWLIRRRNNRAEGTDTK